MNTTLLLPSNWKRIGWFILVPATVLGLFVTIGNFEFGWLNTKVFAIFNCELLGKCQTFCFIKTNITNTLAGSLFIAGALMVGFSKEKMEDEFIANLRLSSLLWAVCVSYILLFLSFVFVYGGAFFTVMTYNMFTVLIIFIARFNFLLYKSAKATRDEE